MTGPRPLFKRACAEKRVVMALISNDSLTPTKLDPNLEFTPSSYPDKQSVVAAFRRGVSVRGSERGRGKWVGLVCLQRALVCSISFQCLTQWSASKSTTGSDGSRQSRRQRCTVQGSQGISCVRDGVWREAKQANGSI